VIIKAERSPSQQYGRDHLFKESDLAVVQDPKPGRPPKAQATTVSKSGRENVLYLRSYIDRPEFMDGLIESFSAENEAELKDVLSQPLISVEFRDGQRIEKYAKGLVNIVGGEGDGTIDLGEILKDG
jgi:hypothetical protein